MRYWVLVLALGGVFALQHRAAIENWIDPPKPIVLPAGVSVVLYATDWCGYCARTRKMLTERKIPFREYDIEKSPEAYAEFERLNGEGVPVLVIKDEVIHGFDEEAIENALRKL